MRYLVSMLASLATITGTACHTGATATEAPILRAAQEDMESAKDRFYSAIWFRDADFVKECLKKDPSLIRCRNNRDGLTALQEACLSGLPGYRPVGTSMTDIPPFYPESYEVVRLLVDRGAPMDVYSAAFLGHTDVVTEEIRKHPEILKQTEKPSEMLMLWAALGGHENVVQLLIDAGSPVNVKSRDDSPLHLAVKYSRGGVVEQLLDAHADVNAMNGAGQTPLVCACSLGGSKALPLARLLLAHSAKVNTQDDFGDTALHNAVWVYPAVDRNQVELVRFLLSRGADVNIAGFDGKTPLHRAAYRGNPEMVKALLEGGANPQARDNRGNTPLQIAIDNKQEEVAALLRRYEPTQQGGR